MRGKTHSEDKDQSIIISSKFYDNLKHILFINRVIGLFPINVTKTGDLYILKWSWLRVIIGNICVLAFATLALTGVIISYRIEQVYNIRFKELASKIVTIAELLTLELSWLIGQISFSILFQEYWKYLKCLSKCDDRMGACEPTKKNILVIFLVFLFTFTCLGTDIYMWAQIALPITGVSGFVWKMIPFYFPYAFSVIIQLNFWISVNEIKRRLEKLNDVMVNYMNFLTRQFKADDNESKVFGNLIKPNQNFKIVNKPKNTLTHTKVSLSENIIKNFIHIYENIVSATNAANKFYGIIMTTILFTVIICLIITPYILYQQVLNAHDPKFLFSQTYWMVCHILRLLLIIEPCYLCEKTEQETKDIVTRLLHFDLSDTAYKQVKLFWYTTRAKNIEFSARGTAVINRALLPTIGGAVFTYLAILFQYHKS